MSLRSRIAELERQVQDMSDAQAQLDQRTATLEGIVSGLTTAITDTTTAVGILSGEITTLKQQIAGGTPPAALDFTGIDKALADAQAALTSAQTLDTTASTDAGGAAPAPAPTGTAPAAAAEENVTAPSQTADAPGAAEAPAAEAEDTGRG